MRPKLLEIEGLQSFRESQKIEFDGLGETGLFGIFGPTGSGKSTVLDAITFALYGKVKRAERGTQGIINTNLNTARVTFTFELLKDGNRKTYRVERTYQRKKGSDNSCEPKIARLIEVTQVGEIPVCDKSSEVSSSIERLLGLSHDDFTRAVVLPQNSFQEFLLLDNAKKREMLERIFYLEEYGKQLGEKLNRKMSRLKSHIDRLSGELSAYMDASNEALEEAQKAMVAAIMERSNAEKELKLLEAKYNEAKEVWQLIQELSLVSQKEEDHIASRQAVSEKRLQLEKALKTEGLLEMIRNNKELSTKMQETEKQLREILNKIPEVFSSLQDYRQKHEDLKNETFIEQPKLVSLKARLSDALSIKAEIEAIRNKINEIQIAAKELKQEISDKNVVICKETGELQVLELSINELRREIEPLKTDPEYRQQIQEGAMVENEVETLTGNVNKIKIKVEEMDGVISGLEQQIEQKSKDILLIQKSLDVLKSEKQNHEAIKPEDRNAVLQYKEEIHSVQTVYGILMLKKHELDGLRTRLDKQQSNMKLLHDRELNLGVVKAKAEDFCKQCRLEFEKAVKAVERNTAYMLSKDLREGQACPVCGSEHHPSPAVLEDKTELSVLETEVENAEQRLVDAEKALKDAEKGYLIADEQVKALNEQIIQATQELELKIKEYNDVKLRLPEELRSFELEQLFVELERRENLSIEKNNAIEAWEKKLEAYMTDIQKFSEQLSKDKLIEKELYTESKVNKEHRGQSERALMEATGIFNDKSQKYQEFIQFHSINSVATELKRIAENDHKQNYLQKQIDQSQELLKKKLSLIEQLKEELQVLNSNNVKIEADSINLLNQKSEKEIKIKDLAGNVDIEAEIVRIDAKLEEYRRLDKQYQDSLTALETQHNQLKTDKSLFENQKKIYTENLKNEENRLQNALVDKGFENSDEVGKSIIAKEKQKALNDEINAYDHAERSIIAQKSVVIQKLNFRSITEDEWNGLRTTYHDMIIFKEECVSRSEVAKNNFASLKNKHDKWLELSKAYNESANKYGLFEQIQKLLRAERGKDNSFIDYIAEERLRYVAAKASEILGIMTRYKYALELDIDAGFIIRDYANGGVHRMVSSLSGGETFITSLSLALALSEQIQLKGQSPLEFFFLDEGFGTLDNNLLDTVVDTLERLGNKERVIGLISHVPELRRRIARRLIVEPPSLQGDGSRVKMEKA